jgi:hypothetical protein
MPALLFAPLVLVFEPRDANTSNNGQGIIGIPRSLTRTKSLLKLWQTCQGVGVGACSGQFSPAENANA